jgi:hypothetical protein
MEVWTLCPNQYKYCALHAHHPEPETCTINLLVEARYETPTVGALDRGVARLTTRFSKLWMAGSDVDTTLAPEATERSRNSDDALGNEENKWGPGSPDPPDGRVT